MAASNNKASSSKFMPSGYEYEFVLDVPDEYICQICFSPMWKPVQTKCGHRFCKDCLEEANKRTKPPVCPMDRQQLCPKKDVFEDKAVERLILSFMIKCPSQLCQWQGELGDLKEHSCTPTSAALTINCPNKCGKKIRREKISDHVSSECAMTVVPCVYHRLGCSIKTRRKSVDKHMEKSIRHHFDITCGRLLLLEDENRKLKANQKETEQQCKNLSKNFQTLQGRKKDLDKETKYLKDDMERQSDQMKNLEKNLQTLLSHKGDFIKELGKIKKEMKEQDSKQTANLETVRKDNEKVAQEVEWTIMEATRPIKKSIDKVNDDFDKTRKHFDNIVNNFNRRVEILFYFLLIFISLLSSFMNWETQDKNKNYFGELQQGLNRVNSRLAHKLIFNMENFDGMLRQAKNRHEDSVHREVFYTKKPGYKLEVTVYPNGYGRGKHTHVSLFVQIARGKYDAILPWPFNKTITISVLDQKEEIQQRNNVEVLIDPKKISTKYIQRPVTALNERYGFEQFVSHKHLEMENFLSSGSLFVRLEIESI